MQELLEASTEFGGSEMEIAHTVKAMAPPVLQAIVRKRKLEVLNSITQPQLVDYQNALLAHIGEQRRKIMRPSRTQVLTENTWMGTNCTN
jgi:hypothetical protein